MTESVIRTDVGLCLVKTSITNMSFAFLVHNHFQILLFFILSYTISCKTSCALIFLNTLY